MSTVPPGPGSAPGPTSSDARRGPRVFRADDPALVETVAAPDAPPRDTPRAAADAGLAPNANPGLRATAGDMLDKGFRWGTLLVSALAAAASIAAGLWFTRFVSVGLERDDWLGQVIRTLMAVAGVAALVLLVREWIGWRRLSRLGRLRRDVEQAITAKDTRAERRLADRIQSLYRGRPELAWALDRIASHRADVHDPAALLTLVERDLVAPLDISARRLITTSAKRVATVTALAPLASIAFAFIVVENLGLLRRLATLYGGRPGFAGALRLGRSVVGNLIAAGGLALTDDLLGQFIGQDVLRRLSRRLGEGAFNGALTARIGVAAIGVVRPLPYLEASQVRVRDILAEVVRPSAGAAGKPSV